MKKIIRKQIINLLSNLPQHKKQQYSISCIEQIIELPEYQQAQCIAVYLANDFELDMSSLIEQAWLDNKKIVVPKCDYVSQTMVFVPLNATEDIIKDDKNILTSRQQTVITDIDVMIVPGLAFTEAGYRIGYGRGFYDKYLAKYPEIFTLSMLILPQIVDFVPESFDVPIKKLIKSKYI